jgi:hypothetical protein
MLVWSIGLNLSNPILILWMQLKVFNCWSITLFHLVLTIVLLHFNHFKTLISCIFVSIIFCNFSIAFIFIWNFISYQGILLNFSSAWFNKVIIIGWILIEHLNILWIDNIHLWTISLLGIWYKLLRKWLNGPFFSILFSNLCFTF